VTIVMRHPRYDDQSRKIEPTADGAAVDFRMQRPRAKLKVVSRPAGATVTVDGRSAGKTPLVTSITGYEMTSVTISAPNMVTERRKVYARGTTTVAATLKVQRDAVTGAHDFEVAAAPEAMRTADDEPAARRGQAELDQRHRRARRRVEVHRDHGRALESVELPLDLLAKSRIVDRLAPARVPVGAARIEDRDRAVGERGDDLVLPRRRRTHLDRPGEKHGRAIRRPRLRRACDHAGHGTHYKAFSLHAWPSTTSPSRVAVGVGVHPARVRASSSSSAVGKWSHTETASTRPSHVQSSTST
jgi:hypothetical protein